MGGFDDAVAAALYSQLTGVLAGFSFAGMVVILTQRLTTTSTGDKEKEEASNRALILLLASFLGLVATSLSYAVVAAEKTDKIAAVEQSIVALPFATSTLALILAIHELLRVLAKDMRNLSFRLTGAWAPLVAMTFFAAGALEVGVRYDGGSAYFSVTIFAFALEVVAFLAIPWLRNATKVPRPSDRAYSVLAAVVVAIVIVSSISVPVMSAVANQGLAGDALLFLLTAISVVAGLSAASFTVFCARANPS